MFTHRIIEMPFGRALLNCPVQPPTQNVTVSNTKSHQLWHCLRLRNLQQQQKSSKDPRTDILWPPWITCSTAAPHSWWRFSWSSTWTSQLGTLAPHYTACYCQEELRFDVFCTSSSCRLLLDGLPLQHRGQNKSAPSSTPHRAGALGSHHPGSPLLGS